MTAAAPAPNSRSIGGAGTSVPEELPCDELPHLYLHGGLPPLEPLVELELLVEVLLLEEVLVVMLPDVELDVELEVLVETLPEVELDVLVDTLPDVLEVMV